MATKAIPSGQIEEIKTESERILKLFEEGSVKDTVRNPRQGVL